MASAIICLFGFSLFANPTEIWSQTGTDRLKAGQSGDPGKSYNLSSTPVTVTFKNESGANVDLVWVDYGGVEQPNASIKPGQSVTTKTSHGALWRFKQSGQVVGYYQARKQANQVHPIGNPTPIPPGPNPPETQSKDPGRSVTLSPTAVSVKFKNSSTTPVDVIWVDYSGNETAYGTLHPGQEKNQGTGHGHLWRFKQNGQVIAFYQATQQAHQAFAVGSAVMPNRPSDSTPDMIVSEESDARPFAPLANPHVTADWMGANYEILKDRRLNRIALPGTHNSGTYDLTRYGVGDTFDDLAPDLDDIKTVMAKLSIGLGDGAAAGWPHLAVLSGLGSETISTVFHGWSECQEQDIFEQLYGGIRSLDFRVCTDRNGTLRICHGELGPAVETILNDIRKFAAQHPAEIVVIRFTHFYPFGNTNEEQLHAQLKMMIDSKLQGKIVPNSLKPSSTLNDIWKSGKQIVVIFDRYKSRDFWPEVLSSSYQKTDGTWDREDFESATQNFVNSLPAKNDTSETDGFSILGCEASIAKDPSLIGLSIDPTGNYPGKVKTLAAEINPVVLGWIKNRWSHKNFNIIQVDYYNKTGIVNLCKFLNGIPVPAINGLNSDSFVYGIRETDWGNWKLGIEMAVAWLEQAGVDAVNWVGQAGTDAVDWAEQATNDAVNWADELLHGEKVAAPAQGATATGVPEGIRHYKITLFHVSNWGSGNDGGDDIELYGSVSAIPDGKFYTNVDSNQFLFNKRAGDRVILGDTESRSHYSRTTRKDFYIRESQITQPYLKEIDFLGRPTTVTIPGSNVKIVSRLMEHDDFNNDKMYGSVTLDLSNLAVGHYKEDVFYVKGGEGEKVRIYYAVSRVK